jgi:transaldolase
VKIFIDSADIDEIKQFYSWGIADGITTNPSLLKKAVDSRKKVDMKSYLGEILMVARGTPVSLEVTERSADGMIEQGRKLYKMFNGIADNVYIKIPINPAFEDNDGGHFDGIAAIKALKKSKIPINCTLIFTPEQALLAAKAGADFVSPFAGRIDDYIRKENKIKFDKTDYYPMNGTEKSGKELTDNGIVSGIDLVAECVDIMKSYGLETEVLAASLRNPRQVREAALVGADIATLPFSVIQDMLKHYKTYEGMKNFTNDIVEDYVKLTSKKK